jgi:hypothetical protein
MSQREMAEVKTGKGLFACCSIGVRSSDKKWGNSRGKVGKKGEFLVYRS